MGLFTSRQKKTADHIVSQLGKRGVYIEDKPDEQKIVFLFVGVENDKAKDDLIYHIRKLNEEGYRTRIDDKNTEIGNGMVVYEVTLNKEVYEAVQEEIRKTGKTLSSKPKKAVAVSSFFQFKRQNLEGINFDLGTDGMLMITVPNNATLTPEERSYISGLGVPKPLERGTRITITDTGRNRNLINALKQLDMYIVEKQPEEGAEEKKIIPKWVSEVKAMKATAPDAIEVVTVVRPMKQPVVRLVVHESIAEDVTGTLGVANIRYNASGLDAETQARLKAPKQDNAQWRQITILDQKAAEAATQFFGTGGSRGKTP